MPNQASPRGTYLLVAGRLRDQIEQDQDMDRLPSHADIVREYGVSRGVAIRAVDVLREEGLIASVPGGRWKVVRDGQPADGRPLADRVSDVITSDGLQIGDPFPSSVALCDRFGVARPTMRSALDRLEARGLVSKSSQGKVRTVLALPGREGKAK